MKVEANDCQKLEKTLGLEWLETNGRGGFASGTVAGPNTRRDHALLLIARKPPTERFVLVNHLEEWIELDELSYPLSANCYAGAVHPHGYEHLVSFSSEPWPTWTYQVETVRLQREIFCPRRRDMVLVRWRLLAGASQILRLKMRPMLTGRDYHATHHENGAVYSEAVVSERRVAWCPYGNLPTIQAFHNGGYRHEPDWYRRIQFPIEQERGLDHEEDWWSPGELSFALTKKNPGALVLTTEPIESVQAEDLIGEEQRRRRQLVGSAPNTDALARALWPVAESYLVERGKQRTVIAGYPWFADWGRDTFISLPGLCLVTGRWEIAWEVVEAFASQVSEGMVPNRFPDAGEQPEYNTIDASLWFVHTVDRYLTYSKDEARVRQIAWQAIKKILDGYRRGTRYGIHMDTDGLITWGVPGAQLTWMDAKIGDRVVTPRYGKPVEIQALWIRALAVAENLATQFGESALAVRCREDRERAAASFQDRFWYEAGGYLYDVIDGPEGNDAALRPNQVYVVAHCPELLSKEQTKRVVQVIEEQLLTPVGLRTLAPGHPQYRSRCEGGVSDRDDAYHQGTVWPFLLGPFITAWLTANGKSAVLRTKARTFLSGLEQHLEEACLGQISEIFDGEAPHRPRGCFAQAWSVAEPLRALLEDLGVGSRRSVGTKATARKQNKPPSSAAPRRTKRR
ncbi:MAG: amylo-alpha-1,6-glucosidase [Nitrospiraceae bacterium]